MLAPAILLGLTPAVYSCTTLAFGKSATAEGSPMLTYNADSTSSDFRVAYIPAQDHAPGALRPVYPYINPYPRFVGGRSPVYAPQKQDGSMQDNTSAIGHIPQVSHTFGYWEASLPIMNEKGVSFGESTTWAKIRVLPRGAGGTALFYARELMQIALERCSTARCAISTMGYWAETEGWYGEEVAPSCGGEALSVSDSSEAWMFHILADHDGGAVWAAQRVPDNHVAVAANNFIIRKIDFGDRMHANFMWSTNILTVAQQLVQKGDAATFCEDAATFDFLQCFGSDLRTDFYDPLYGPHLPDPFYTTLRMWRIQNLVAPSAGFTDPTDNAFDLPFSFPVDEPVSLNQAMNIMGDHYNGTAFALAKDGLGGPYEDPNRDEGGVGMLTLPGKWPRAISVMRTSYSIIPQTKQNGHHLFWYAAHQPATSIYLPFFVEATDCHQSFMQGSQLQYERASAWWTFCFLCNWMRSAWNEIGERFVFPKRNHLQAEVIASVATIRSNFTQEQVALQGEVVAKWASFADFLVMAFNNGFINIPAPGGQYGYPKEWLQKMRPDIPILDISGLRNGYPTLATADFVGFAGGICVGAIGAFVLAFKVLRQSHNVDVNCYGRLASA